MSHLNDETNWHFFADSQSRDFIITDHERATVDCIPFGTNTIAKVVPVSPDDHHKNNARLIAAAPAMLRALQFIADWEPTAAPDEPRGLSIMEVIDTAQAAIALTDERIRP